MLTIRSFLLAVELFHLQLTISAFLLTRGVHFRTPNRTNLEKTPIFSGAPMETIQTFPKQLVDLSWPNSIYSKTSQMSFDLFNCCLWHHLHCQDAEHFFAEFSAGKTDHFFGGKISSTTRGSVNGGKLAHFSLDFWPKIRWILSPFPLRKTTFSSQMPLGSQAWSCHFFLS